MRQHDVDFRRIRAHLGVQSHGFEELCCQLASLEPQPTGSSFLRKGLGGDAGIECLLRFKNKTEVGWQTKYFFKLEQSQLAQLDESIEAALEKHPRLRRYVVCLPFDLRDSRVKGQITERQRWDRWVQKWVRRRRARALTIELWSKSNLIEKLTRDEPSYAGRLAYWFDELAFSVEWFRQQFEKAKASLGARYSPETNVELPIRQNLLAFVRDPMLTDEIEDWILKIEKARHQAVQGIEEVARIKKILDPSTKLRQVTGKLIDALSNAPKELDMPVPLQRWREHARGAETAARDLIRWVWDQSPEEQSGQKASDRFNSARYYVSELSNALSNISDRLEQDQWSLVNDRRLLVYGAPGVGKSHLFGDVAEHQLEHGYPVLLVTTGTLVEDDPWRQILDQFDLTQFSVREFLGALDAAAQAAGVRALLLIDALNERHGIDLWRTRLSSFLQSIERFPRVAVAVSCRSSYLPYVIPPELSEQVLPRVEHHGFAGRAGEAARLYLEKRGITRPGAPNLVPEFDNPLFLKTCCDFLDKEGKKELPKGLRGVTAIFRYYVDAVTHALNAHMGLDPYHRIVPRAIEALVDALAASASADMSVPEAIAVLDGIHPSQGRREDSLLLQLEHEGMIAIEPSGDSGGTERVRFTFERFSDHATATRLLDQHLAGASSQAAFAKGSPLFELVAGEESYKRTGTIEAVAVQLPERVGVELPDALPTDAVTWVAWEAFRESLLWREQSKFTQRTLELLQRQSADQHRDFVTPTLIAIATEPDNPFNATFLHSRLMVLPLYERDRRWSIYVAQHGDSGSPIETLISWARNSGRADIDLDRLQLAVMAIAWLLSTSNREIRDTATKALTTLLTSRLSVASRLVRRFEFVNDPYVLERVLAAAYGAAIQSDSLVGLEELASAVYAAIFNVAEVVPNILIRDYARNIVEFAELNVRLSGDVDISRTRPPYRSAWPPEYVPDELIESYREDGKDFTDQIVGSTTGFIGDFGHYVVEPVVRHWSSSLLSDQRLATANAEYLRWRREFDATASPHQDAALTAVLDAARRFAEHRAKMVHEGEQPLREALDAADDAFKKVLDPNAWEDYRVRAQHHVKYGMWHIHHVDTRPATFNSDWAKRWICKRAHDLGWTPDRFGAFDRSTSSQYRTDHRLERIGKKYQWLALYELTARLADNVAMVPDAWSHREAVYEGAWQVGLRNIDPSLLISETTDDGWRQWNATWWVPVAPRLKPVSPESRLAWLETAEDLINDSRLIDVTDPKTGRRWLVLAGFSSWNQYRAVSGEREIERDTWFRLKCLVVRAQDLRTLLRRIRNRRLTADHDLPEFESSAGFLGEYDWHASFGDVPDWVEWDPDYPRTRSVSLRTVVTDYTASKGGYDHSVTQTIHAYMPARWLKHELSLRLSDGKRVTYVNDDGQVLFFDPSVSAPGPHAALVDREAFLALLEREQLTAIWVISGEKGAFGGRPWGHGFGGRHVHTYTYVLKSDGFRVIRHTEWDRPTSEQLREFLGEPRAPVRTQQQLTATRATKKGRTRSPSSRRPRRKAQPPNGARLRRRR